MCSTLWTDGPHDFALEPREVHVYLVDLASMPNLHTSMMAVDLLSADERTRADRFRIERDRSRYIAAHVTLRLLLARYLHSIPAEIRLCYNPYGKPGLVPQDNPLDIQFSLSHTSDLVLFAIARSIRVGLDVESIRRDISWHDLASRFFSETEARLLQELPAAQQLCAFYTCWVRKEALVKALGLGLSFPLDQFTVSLRADRPVFLHPPDHVLASADWRLHDLDCGAGYAAALVTEGTPLVIRCYVLTAIDTPE